MTVVESFKKTVLAGLGAAAVSKDKVQAGLEELVAQGKITTADARATAEKIAAAGRREFEEASALAGERVREFVSYADGDFARRVAALEARVAALEVRSVKKAKSKG